LPVGEGGELVAVELAVETGARAARVRECDLPALLERAGGGNPEQRAFELRASGERGAHGLVALGREQQRKRRCALPQVGAGDLAGLDRDAGAVEDVVGDLEGDAERQPERPGASGEPARRLEELPGLEPAALEVGVDGRVGIEAL